MFSPSDFGSPAAPTLLLRNNRRVGLILLIICVMFCMGFSLAMDITVFTPFSATYAITLTAQAAASPTPKPTRTPSQLRSTQTATPAPGQQQAKLETN